MSDETFSFVMGEKPQKQPRNKSLVYDELLKKLITEGQAGKSYQIRIKTKEGKPKSATTIYQALVSRISKNPSMKEALRVSKLGNKENQSVWIDVLSKEETKKKKS
jgi:hypothetical protein